MIKTITERALADIRKYLWGGILAAVYYVVVHWLLPVSCPYVLMTGLPCAGCGMTRAVIFVLTGQFARAFYMNPMAFPLVLFALYCLFVRYVKGRPVKGFAVGVIILCIGLLLAYFVRMYLYFPGRVPYVYTGNNLMENHIPGYRRFIEQIWSAIVH